MTATGKVIVGVAAAIVLTMLSVFCVFLVLEGRKVNAASVAVTVGCGVSNDDPARIPTLGDEERTSRGLRRRAFRGELTAQLDLAQRAGDGRADVAGRDPVESATWMLVAAINPKGRASDAGEPERTGLACSAGNRAGLLARLERAVSNLTFENRLAVRNRVIYILSKEGADGFVQLSEATDPIRGPFGESRTQARNAWPNAASLLGKSALDSVVYARLAAGTGSGDALLYLRRLEASATGACVQTATARAAAAAWVAPLEIYPPDPPRGRAAYSDEAPVSEDEHRALGLMQAQDLRLPDHLDSALTTLGIPLSDSFEARAAYLQQQLGEPETRVFDDHLALRAIQLAAMRGAAASETVLGMYYAEGVGVRQDHARAVYWLRLAAAQGAHDAIEGLGVYEAMGVPGVADQDKSAAVALRMAAAISPPPGRRRANAPPPLPPTPSRPDVPEGAPDR